jgi:hypothetical protein
MCPFEALGDYDNMGTDERREAEGVSAGVALHTKISPISGYPNVATTQSRRKSRYAAFEAVSLVASSGHALLTGGAGVHPVPGGFGRCFGNPCTSYFGRGDYLPRPF